MLCACAVQCSCYYWSCFILSFKWLACSFNETSISAIQHICQCAHLRFLRARQLKCNLFARCRWRRSLLNIIYYCRFFVALCTISYLHFAMMEWYGMQLYNNDGEQSNTVRKKTDLLPSVEWNTSRHLAFDVINNQMLNADIAQKHTQYTFSLFVCLRLHSSACIASTAHTGTPPHTKIHARGADAVLFAFALFANWRPFTHIQADSFESKMMHFALKLKNEKETTTGNCSQ